MQHNMQKTPNIALDLPYPPSANGRLIPTNHGLVMTEKGRQYRKDCAQAVLVQQVPRWHRKIRGRLCVWIDVYPPRLKRTRDLDNTLKASLDALTHAGVIEDDEHIDWLHVVRRGPEGIGRLRIQIVAAGKADA